MKKPLLSELTLREKIGQCLLPYQTDLYLIKRPDGSDMERPEEEMRQIIEKNQFGTIWADQVVEHSHHMVDLSEDGGKKVLSKPYKRFLDRQSAMGKIPALRSLDSEYGHNRHCSDLSVTPRGLAVGAANSEELAYRLGECIAKEGRCCGANWRWAPVVDMTNRFEGGCQSRAFVQDDGDRLIRLANAHIRGMQDNGVAGTAKHFPGSDRWEYRDIHATPTINSSTMEEWWAGQGKIFQGIIDGGVYSVMVGHQAFPACDDIMRNGRYIPASVSRKIITNLLKDKMGFKGVVVTDNLAMTSLFTYFDSYEELIINLINAGNDVLLGVYLSAGDIIEKAVLDGRIEESRIDDACQRVLDMKEKLGMFEDSYNNISYAAENIVPETANVNKEIAKRSITLVRDRYDFLPLDKKYIKNVSIICSTHKASFFEKLEELKVCLETRGAKVYMQRGLKSNTELKNISDNSDLIIYAVYIGPYAPKGGPFLYGEECAAYRSAFTSGKEKSIGVSFGYPYVHYDIMEAANTFINAYDATTEAMEAFVKAIYGEIEITGKSPIKLTPLYDRW